MFAMAIGTAFQSNLVLLKTQNGSGAPAEKRHVILTGSRRPPRNSSYLGTQIVCTAHNVTRRPMIASMKDGNSSADDYKKFAEMLGTGQPGKFAEGSNSALREERASTESATSSEAYAEFSEMLGLESKKPAEQEGKESKTVSSLQPRKTEINPRDYQLFDSLLQKSGGTGRKPMKGSKRFMTQAPSFDRKENKRNATFNNEGDVVSLENLTESQTEQSEGSRRQQYMTAEETAQAYAIMMKEFGDGLHGTGVEVLTDDDDEEEEVEYSNKKELLQPPARPGAWNEGEKGAERNRDFEKGGTVREKNEPAKLLKSPQRPADRTASEQPKKVVKGHYTETNEIMAQAEAEQFPQEPLLPKPMRPNGKVRSVPTERGDRESKKIEATGEERSTADTLLPKPIANTDMGGSAPVKANGENEAAELKESVVQTTRRAGREDMARMLMPKPRSKIEKAKWENVDLQFQSKSQQRVRDDLNKAKEISALQVSEKPQKDMADSTVNDKQDANVIKLRNRPTPVNGVRPSESEGRTFETGRSRDHQRRKALFEADTVRSPAGTNRRGRRSLQDLKTLMLEFAMIVYSKDEDDGFPGPVNVGDSEISKITAQDLE